MKPLHTRLTLPWLPAAAVLNTLTFPDDFPRRRSSISTRYQSPLKLQPAAWAAWMPHSEKLWHFPSVHPVMHCHGNHWERQVRAPWREGLQMRSRSCVVWRNLGIGRGESKMPPSIMRWMRSESFCVFILCGIIVAAWLTFNFEAFLKYDSCCMSKLRRMLWAGPSVSIYLYINLWAIKNSLRLYLQVRRCWDFNSTLVNLTFTKFKTQALTAMTPKFHLVHNSSFMISTNIKTADRWTQ